MAGGILYMLFTAIVVAIIGCIYGAAVIGGVGYTVVATLLCVVWLFGFVASVAGSE
jgi:hypothetical protein